MGFMEAIASGFRNYVGFSGRAPRSEYWYLVLFIYLLAIVAFLIDLAVFPAMMQSYGIGPVYTIAALVTFLPGLAVSVRRLHDIDRSGWWLLLLLIPLIGFIILVVWACKRGTVGANRFGPDPLEGKV